MEVIDRFEYHQPTPEQTQRIIAFRQACKTLAALIVETPMEPRCKALAITKLEEVSMRGNQGIVFYSEM